MYEKYGEAGDWGADWDIFWRSEIKGRIKKEPRFRSGILVGVKVRSTPGRAPCTSEMDFSQEGPGI